jgi:hypothetical protein
MEAQVGERTVRVSSPLTRPLPSSSISVTPVELDQPDPSLRRQRGDLGALVSRRPFGVVLVVRRLEIGSIQIWSNVRSSDHSRLCARSRASTATQLSHHRTFGIGQWRGSHPAVYTEAHVTDR